MSLRSKDDSLLMGTCHGLWTRDNYTRLEEASNFWMGVTHCCRGFCVEEKCRWAEAVLDRSSYLPVKKDER
jgi:hypothetical protein